MYLCNHNTDKCQDYYFASHIIGFNFFPPQYILSILLTIYLTIYPLSLFHQSWDKVNTPKWYSRLLSWLAKD